jgi:hypothetical protein
MASRMLFAQEAVSALSCLTGCSFSVRGGRVNRSIYTALVQYDGCMTTMLHVVTTVDRVCSGFVILSLLLSPAAPTFSWAQTDSSTVDSAPPPAVEQTEPATAESIAPETVEPVAAPVSPSVQISGSIWRSKPGIVFLQTPIGPLSLSSKTTLRDIRGSHKITLWIHGTTTVIDVREKGAGTFVHRYVTALPNFTSSSKNTVTVWTPEGEQSLTLGAFETKIAGRPDHVPFTVEIDRSGAVKGLHDVQFDLQVNQVPRSASPLHLLLNGTVSKVKSNYVFLKTPLGIVTVSGKTGVRNAKVGQEMSVWVQEQHVAIDLYHDGLASPARRFLSGPLTYDSPDRTRLVMQTPEGEQSVMVTPRTASLASLKEGWPITVEIDQQGGVVDIRRVN